MGQTSRGKRKTLSISKSQITKVKYRQIPHQKNMGEMLGVKVGRLGETPQTQGVENCNISPKHTIEIVSLTKQVKLVVVSLLPKSYIG